MEFDSFGSTHRNCVVPQDRNVAQVAAVAVAIVPVPHNDVAVVVVGDFRTMAAEQMRERPWCCCSSRS